MERIEVSQHVARLFAPVLVVLALSALFPVISVGQPGPGVGGDDPPDPADQVCEVPLAVEQNLLGANLMFLVDNSTSMNAAVYHAGYDPDTVYTGKFTTDSTYYIAADGFRAPVDFDITWPGTPLAYLVASDTPENGLYSGNYLNWVYEHATDEQRDAIPRITRIQNLKVILTDLIYRSERLNLGLTVFFPNGDGGNILAYCEGNNAMSLAAAISQMVANAHTQLGEAMESIMDYYINGGDNNKPSIESPCQYNFIVVVTDGMPTMDLNVSPYLQDADGDGMDPGDCVSLGTPYDNSMDCSDYFDDVAYYMAHEDLRDDMEGDQVVYTYVVGFHEDNRLLQDAADNGLGLFFHATNSSELAMSIEYAVQDILRRISAGSAVAVVSTESGTNNKLYRGKYMPMDWIGYIECFNLPYSDGDVPAWEAGTLLAEQGAASRQIITALGGNSYDFVEGSASNLRVAMDVPTDEEAADLISWVRGNDVAGLRDREGWILGDAINSTPVVVGAPADFVTEESYDAFRVAHENRRGMVYVGVNDGMLHAFDAEDGSEVWAFVPEFALPKFQVMADSFYCHTYTCDQTVTVKDLQVSGVWKTILAAGGREGGSSIFALDITDADSPEVLWQNDLPNGKSFHSQLSLNNIGGSPTALVGSGLDTEFMESWLYAYEVDTGDLSGSILLSSNSGRVAAQQMDRNKTSRPEVVDINMDGMADLAYLADLDGSIWRIDFQNTPNPGSWDVTKLYQGSEAITANPVAALGPNGDIYIFFGTGAYLEVDDMLTLEQNRFVCVFDKHDGLTVGAGDLVDQTTVISPIDAARGWYVQLWNELGERVTGQAVVIAETVVFTAFKPSDDPCVAGGQSWLYQLAYDTGGFAPEVDDSQDLTSRSVFIGEGIASHPVIDLIQGKAVVQSSDSSIAVENVASPVVWLTVRSWQEVYKNVEASPDTTAGDIQ